MDFLRHRAINLGLALNIAKWRPTDCSPRYTAVDYARLHSHTHCADILTAAGSVATEEIHGMAALTIQTAYRGHR